MPGPSSIALLQADQLTALAEDCAAAAALVFARNGWKWARSLDDRSLDYVPDAAEITRRILHLAEICPLGRSCSSGRLTVFRYIEDEAMHVSVSLDLGCVDGGL